MKISPLSPSRLNLPTIQTDFRTNQLTVELSEAELRAKITELINQGNSIDQAIIEIWKSLANVITQEVLKEVNKLDLSNFTGSWHGVKKPSLANEGISGAVGKLEEDKQDKRDDSLVTSDKSVVGGINEIHKTVTKKPNIIVCDELPEEKTPNTFYFKVTDKQSECPKVATNMGLKIV